MSEVSLFNVSRLDFNSFESLDEGTFSINLKTPEENTLLIINVFDNQFDPLWAITPKDDNPYYPLIKLIPEEKIVLLTAIMKFLYLHNYAEEEYAKMEM